MPPVGFVKDLIKKFESGLQNTMPRRHGSVASRPNDPNSKCRSAPPRTVSTSALESADVNVVRNDTSATASEDHNETKGCCGIRTDGDIPASGCGTHLTNKIVTKAGGADETNRINAVPLAPQPSLASCAEVLMQSSFLGIPMELRFIIYNYVFPSSRSAGEEETIIYCTPHKLKVIGPFHSQICRVNRQIYEETKELLYGRILVFLSRDALIKFSAMRTSQLESYIRSICMKARVTDWVPAVKTLILPQKASLTVHWPIRRDLWRALLANKTLQYRKVRLQTDCDEKSVIFECFKLENIASKVPSYEELEGMFAMKRILYR